METGGRMYYEPDTVWGRTEAGDHEITRPKSGLSVAQRRLLKQLAPPRTFTSLAARHRVPPPKLEHELLRLAQLELVAFQRPGAPRPRTAPRIDLALPPGAGAALAGRMTTLPLALVAFVLGFALVVFITA
jgi:hypothetical protein